MQHLDLTDEKAAALIKELADRDDAKANEKSVPGFKEKMPIGPKLLQARPAGCAVARTYLELPAVWL
jgi:hypothetical protein